jgi:Fe-S oxidoreductase
MIENAIEVTERCRHCLMCRHVCPVGNITRMETLTPHGWAQLVALERRGLSTWNRETVDALYKCADCGNCRTHSVYDSPLPEGIVAARAVVAEQGLAPAVVYEMSERLRRWENPYVSQRPVESTGSGEAALFVGDEAHFLRPQLLAAALSLLRAVGVEPVLVGQGRNTGYLPSSLGLPGIAGDLALANLAEIRATHARRLFVLSPGDYFAFRQMYDERLGIELPPELEVVGVIPFLARQRIAGNLRLTRSADERPYAYVDPTHSVRVEGRYESPRLLLEAVLPAPAHELFWRRNRAYPCGDLALQFTQPELADALTRARLADAAEAGATLVLSDGAGSLAHLDRHAAGFGLQVQGVYELLAGHLAH